jgi:hypothetical protein
MQTLNLTRFLCASKISYCSDIFLRQAPRRPSHFKINDVKRAVAAARKAGLNPTAIEVDPSGRIRVTTSKSSEAHGGDLDAWMDKRQKDARTA